MKYFSNFKNYFCFWFLKSMDIFSSYWSYLSILIGPWISKSKIKKNPIPKIFLLLILEAHGTTLNWLVYHLSSPCVNIWNVNHNFEFYLGNSLCNFFFLVFIFDWISDYQNEIIMIRADLLYEIWFHACFFKNCKTFCYKDWTRLE